eukprot:360786-Chlamydomonas_euryale.AAC.5
MIPNAWKPDGGASAAASSGAGAMSLAEDAGGRRRTRRNWPPLPPPPPPLRVARSELACPGDEKGTSTTDTTGGRAARLLNAAAVVAVHICGGSTDARHAACAGRAPCIGHCVRRIRPTPPMPPPPPPPCACGLPYDSDIGSTPRVATQQRCSSAAGLAIPPGVTEPMRYSSPYQRVARMWYACGGGAERLGSMRCCHFGRVRGKAHGPLRVRYSSPTPLSQMPSGFAAVTASVRRRGSQDWTRA